MFLNFALNSRHVCYSLLLACRLQLDLTNMHVSYSCDSPADMFESVSNHLQHICSCGAELNQVYMLHLPQTRSYVPMLVLNQLAGKHNCTRPSGMYVTIAPNQHPCLFTLHTISIHVFYSFILSASMYVAFAPDHQPCL